jgi:hypothetical protein
MRKRELAEFFRGAQAVRRGASTGGRDLLGKRLAG